MSSSNAWHNAERTVLIQTQIDPWTWPECAVAMGEAAQMMSSVPHEVYMIEDLSRGSKLPAGSVMAAAKAILDQLPENWAVMVVVSNSVFVKAMVNTFVKVFSNGIGKKLHHATSLEEAHKIIGRHTTAKN